MMSDLRAAESRLRSDIAAAESAAHRAELRISSLRAAMDEEHNRVNSLISDIGQFSGELSDYRDQLYDLDSEIAHLQVQQEADHRLISHNERLIGNIQQDLSVLEEDLEHNQQAIEQVRQHAQVLQREADLARQRIDANKRHIQRLEVGVQQINNYLEAERQRMEQDRRSQMADVEAHSQLAMALRSSLDPARVRRFGGESSYLKALTILEHAEESTRLGRLEAARATYQEAQREFSQVARDVDAREREYFRYRSRCEANLKQLGDELQRIRTDDMLYWHAADYQALQARFADLERRFQNAEFDQAGRPEQVITALEQLTDNIAKLQQDVSRLEQQLPHTIQQATMRLEMMQKIVNTVMDIWGDNSFDVSYEYARPDDPKSTLKIQTVRPNRPNVTVNMDLDGTFQFSWTGYVGMECAKDIKQFEEKMRSHHKVEVAILSAKDKPGQPNPDLPRPSTLEPIIIKPAEPAKEEKKRAENK